MNVTLEDYIASNSELQDAINCAKAQINAAKMGKNLLEKVSEFPNDSELGAVEISIDEQDQTLWKGPSSKKTFLSLNTQEDIDNDEFEKMYEKLNSDLKQVDINENPEMNKSSGQQFKFDLRQVLKEKRLEANDYLPPVTSQQWRLREPNVGRKPAGMPPLVPISFLDELSCRKTQKTNNRNARNWKTDAFKVRTFSEKRNKNNRMTPVQLQYPKQAQANAGVLSVAQLNHKNFLQHPSFRANIPNLAALFGAVGGVQYLPLNTIVTAAPNFNEKNANGTLTGTIGNPVSCLSLNNLDFNGNLSFGEQRSAAAFNNVVPQRSNLNGIRGVGRVERGQHATLQNDNNLRSAVNMFLNIVDGNNNNSAMNMDETTTSSNTNRAPLLSAAVENMLKRGIVIKLAKPGVGI